MSDITRILKGKINKNIVLLQNFSYISLLQLFSMLMPLIIYPYLVRILGGELYGWVILAQVIASYCSIIVDFGFKKVCAKYVSIYRNDKAKLSNIMSSILILRLFLWIISFIVYIIIISIVNDYYRSWLLFFFSFFVTFNELLFPQFYFQGIEKMKFITIITMFIRLLSLILIFVFVKQKADYLLVPLMLSISYLIGGMVSLYIIFFKDKLRFVFPKYGDLKFYFLDALPIFMTDAICTIKDKLNYILLGNFLGGSSIVIFDLGTKFSNVLLKPVEVLNTVLFPKIAKERNLSFIKKIAMLILLLNVLLVIVFNVFLPEIVLLFIPGSIDLWPIRIYTLVPIILGLSSYISSNVLISLGYNKYLLYSIVFTTFIYLFILFFMYINDYLNSVFSFILLSVLSYFGELIFRLLMAIRIFKLEKNNN